MGRKRKRTTNGGGNFNDYEAADVAYYEQPDVEGAFRYNYYGDLPWDLQRYWKIRFDMFSRYNDGVWMTEDSWFEITPEAVATKITGHITASLPPSRSIIIDVFCGVGGNTIALALSGKFKRVYAIEKNPAALACAKRNAEIYGVADQITWFEGDCFEILGVDETKKAGAIGPLKDVIGQFGVIFASPPWGGPGYKSAEVFDLDTMQPYSLEEIHTKLSKVTKNMVLYLPRTSDLQQIAKCVEDGKQTQVVHYCTYGSSRALCAYLGDWKALNIPKD